MKILRWFYLLPLYPIIFLLGEVEKFGKYIQFGKIDLEDAYKIGYERGVRESKGEFEYMLRHAISSIKSGHKELCDKFESDFDVIEENVETAHDFDSGEPVRWADKIRLKSLYLRLSVKPKNEYHIMPTRSEIVTQIKETRGRA